MKDLIVKIKSKKFLAIILILAVLTAAFFMGAPSDSKKLADNTETAVSALTEEVSSSEILAEETSETTIDTEKTSETAETSETVETSEIAEATEKAEAAQSAKQGTETAAAAVTSDSQKTETASGSKTGSTSTGSGTSSASSSGKTGSTGSKTSSNTSGSSASSGSTGSKTGSSASSGSTSSKTSSSTSGSSASSGSTSSKTDSSTSGSSASGSKTETASESKSDSSTSSETKKSYSCTLSISCKTVLNNMDSLDESKKSVVPSSGVILSKTTCSFEEGDTVYDVLKRTCKSKGISLDGSSSYIEGIGNLYEFDCGSGSGWMYSVNGSFPSKGCGSYKLSDGDSIKWVYTCNLGKDL